MTYMLSDEVGVEPFDPFAPEWNEYGSQPDEVLLATWARILGYEATGTGCDNFAPGTCCNHCNMYEVRDELIRRGLLSSLV